MLDIRRELLIQSSLTDKNEGHMSLKEQCASVLRQPSYMNSMKYKKKK
jgi:hypothetical protein